MNAPAAVDWKLRAFQDLAVHELYALLQLRSEVFVVEQSCVFQDLDGSDAAAMHLQGFAEGRLVAYARCLAAGVKFAEASIGRIVTRKADRGTGLGHLLVTRAMEAVHDLWGRQAIRIGAQAHLTNLYRRHGFADVGLPYLEDGIDHMEMVWHPSATTNQRQP